ncbi:hypothetical protein [Sphingomonas sp. PB4P5]|uniref:hypothetical protein n=1 Tax=Parasphingomonas puruogangriensis TaxID=3096155 RepID=UPI002FC91D0C
MTIKPMAALAAILLLAACGADDNAPGAVSQSEQQQLDDAAAMLDANSVDANAVSIDGENESQPQ